MASTEAGRKYWRARRPRPEYFFEELSDEIQERDFVGITRVSTPKQRENLADQQAVIEEALEGLPGPLRRLKAVFREIGHGSEVEWLREAARAARSMGAALIGESVCRFVRTEGYDPKNPEDELELEDYFKVFEVCASVKMVTVLAPSATGREVRSHAIQRGHSMKDTRGGFPAKKKRKYPGYKLSQRVKYTPLALKLKEEGKSLNEIAEIISAKSGYRAPRSTIHNWLVLASKE